MNEASLEQLEESLRGHESLSEVNDFNELTKKYIETGETVKSLKGELEGKVVIPGEDSSDEDRATFWKGLGVPEKPDDYGINKPEDWPENMPYNEAMQQKYTEIAHKLNLTPAQAKEMYAEAKKMEIEEYNEIVKTIQENRAKAEAELKQAWPGEKYKENGAKALRAAEHFLGDKFDEWSDARGLKDDPTFLQMLYGIYEKIGESEFVDDKGVSGGGGDEIKRTPSGMPVFSSYGEKK